MWKCFQNKQKNYNLWNIGDLSHHYVQIIKYKNSSKPSKTNPTRCNFTRTELYSTTTNNLQQLISNKRFNKIYKKKKKSKFCLLQIDQEKPFDKIDRPHLFHTIEKHGFSKSYIQFIEILYKDYISLIMNNGFLSETAMMLRETTENVNNDNTITGLTIPNSKKQLKISQYTGDSNFFLLDQKLVKKCIKKLPNVKRSHRRHQ